MAFRPQSEPPDDRPAKPVSSMKRPAGTTDRAEMKAPARAFGEKTTETPIQQQQGGAYSWKLTFPPGGACLQPGRSRGQRQGRRHALPARRHTARPGRVTRTRPERIQRTWRAPALRRVPRQARRVGSRRRPLLPGPLAANADSSFHPEWPPDRLALCAASLVPFRGGAP
jgi:hypothetical protein